MPFNILSPRVQDIFKNIYRPAPMPPGDSIMDYQIPNFRPNLNTTQNRRFDTLPDIESPNLDAYTAYSKTMPQRESPNWWTKIAAALSGGSAGYFRGPLAGVEAAKTVYDLPYNQKVADWMAQGEPLKNAAMLESQNQGRENTLMRNQMYYGLGSRGLDIKQQDNIAKQAIAEKNLSLIEKRLNQSNFVSTGKLTKDDRLILFDKNTAKEVVLDADVYNSTEEQLASAFDRAKLQSDTSMRNTDVMASTSRRNTDVNAQVSRENNQNTVGGAADRLKTTLDFRAANPDLYRTPARNNAAWGTFTNRQALTNLMLNNPDYKGSIIKINNSGVPYVDPNTGMFGGVDEDTLNQFKTDYQNEIGKMGGTGGSLPSVTPPVSSVTPQTNQALPNVEAPLPPGMAEMEAPTGERQIVPISQVPWFLSRQARRVR